MCGIAGRFHSGSLRPAPAWRGEVDRLLAHRGPDGSGHYRDDFCELVHRRLSIVDLSPAGDQPLWNEDRSLCVVYNGEIYNHRDLRSELESRGHVFHSRSDTEVLVHLYEEAGEQMLARLEGMFALALYDRRRRTLLLGRDRFGIKPLYHAVWGGEHVFASEIKALLALPHSVAALDRQACYDFLSLGYVPEPLTGFEGVEALPPGSFLSLSPAGSRRQRFYEARARGVCNGDLASAGDRAAARLLHAVDQQRIADVPVACMLSGGIDSSLVAAAFSRVNESPPETFNVRFPGRGFDETELARAVAGSLQTRHRTVDLRDWTVTPDLLLGLLRHFDQPFADSSLLPTYLLARAIRDAGFKCALSGDGGDEVFGGYPNVWLAPRLQQLSRMPGWVLRVAEAAGEALRDRTTDRGRRIAKAARLARLGGRRHAAWIAGLSSYLSEEEKRQLLLPGSRERLLPVDRHFEARSNGSGGREALSRHVTENFFAVRLPSDMLKKVDMMSMSVSLETRVPMLDEALVESGLALPHALKTDGRRGKLVLRQLAARWLPEEVATHPKHGFDIPVEQMIGAEFHDMLRDHLLSDGARTRPFVHQPLVVEWLGLFERLGGRYRGSRISRRGIAQRIFTLLALELWLREHDLTW